MAGARWRSNFGDDEKLLGDCDWFADNSGEMMHEVGTKKPNSLGLCDMQGNVSQWCSDFYDDYPPGVALDPTGPAISTTVGSLRVLRGGSWGNEPKSCRAAVRHRIAPVNRYSITGLRVCPDPD
jgi:formylglycine-generating enzyme required for sulfatase activity